tara:strand:- start:166 stop:735 length:570 start_codon:yes stop_codon:yes gene_type:complete
MNDITNKELSLFQRIFLVLLSISLVISIFFFQNGFKSNSMLDQLAKDSLLPEEALSNGRPTVFEFYADWCEACKEMAPAIKEIKQRNQNKVDVVLLNVENIKWDYLLDKYNVNGIPQLNFFNINGEPKGFSVGVRKKNELNDIFMALINESELPEFTKSFYSSNLDLSTNDTELISNNEKSFYSPRSHG